MQAGVDADKTPQYEEQDDDDFWYSNPRDSKRRLWVEQYKRGNESKKWGA